MDIQCECTILNFVLFLDIPFYFTFTYFRDNFEQLDSIIECFKFPRILKMLDFYIWDNKNITKFAIAAKSESYIVRKHLSQSFSVQDSFKISLECNLVCLSIQGNSERRKMLT